MIDASELKIETWPYGEHKGGQHVGINTGVRVTHIPTGTVATCSLARSQHKNKYIALDMIYQAISHPFNR